MLLFDVDNTLYPESSQMSAEIERRMSVFVAEFLGVSLEESNGLRQKGYEEFGTTLRWLQVQCGLDDPGVFLLRVHPENVADYISPIQGLKHMLDSIDLPKAVMTNGPMHHARRVLRHLGIEECFGRIYDLSFNDYQGKPYPQAFMKVLGDLDLASNEVLFIDDVPRYLDGFAALGGQCLLVDETGRHKHAPYRRIQSILDLPDYLENEHAKS